MVDRSYSSDYFYLFEEDAIGLEVKILNRYVRV